MRSTIASLTALAALLSSASAPAQDTESSAGTARQPGKETVRKESVRDIYQSEHSLFGERFTLEPSISYVHSTRNQISLSGFLALDAIFLGNISVDTIKRDTVKAALSLRYDITDDLQFEASLPYLYRRNVFQSAGQQGTTTTLEETVSTSGFGDARFRLFSRWIAETDQRPDVVLNLGVTAPTGREPFGIETETQNDGLLEYPSELPTGNGVWAVSAGTSLLKTVDPAVLFANVGYEATIRDSFDDIDSAPGDQPGRVDLGDTLRFGFGTAFALNERLSLSLSLDQQFVTESEIEPQGGNEEEVVGSGATVSVLNVGASLAMGAKRTLNANVGVGLTDDAPDVTIQVAMPVSM